MQDADAPLLDGDEAPPVEVLNPAGRGRAVLVCEHASSAVPAALGDLGLHPDDRLSHAVWDIGALALARGLSAALDAPLVAARVSRLVYDCNRPPEAADAIPAQSERIAVPGNRGLSPAARAARVEAVYRPFERCLRATLDARRGPTVLVTVHSFTPVYHGQPRAVDLGLLHDADPRLADAMLAAAPAHLPALDTRLNAPYDAGDGVTHTLRAHAVPRGMPNVMIEVKNSLLGDAGGIAAIADGLAGMLGTALAACFADADADAAAGRGGTG